jgi:indolepyruvate ferredoxin oxidoreductase beta subunit
MNKDIILSGVGGQGILSISYIICSAALKKGWNFKQAEVHGMSQRGGAVQAHLRLSDGVIKSDLIPLGKADLTLSVEPLEALRYVQYLASDGVIVSSTTPFVNIPNYPVLDEILDKIASIKNHVLIDSESVARLAGSVRAQNMVMLGASSDFIGIELDALKDFIAELFAAKGDKIIETNYKALELGRNVSRFFTACIKGGMDPLATRLLSSKGHPESLNDETIPAWDKAFDANRAVLIDTLIGMQEPFMATGEKAAMLSEGCSDPAKIEQILTA